MTEGADILGDNGEAPPDDGNEWGRDGTLPARAIFSFSSSLLFKLLPSQELQKITAQSCILFRLDCVPDEDWLLTYIFHNFKFWTGSECDTCTVVQVTTCRED